MCLLPLPALVALAVAAATGAAEPLGNAGPGASVEAAGTVPGAGRIDPTREQRRDAVVAAVEKAAPAVVNISTERIVVRRYSDPFFGFRDDLFDRMFDDFFAPPGRRYRTQSLGSGVLIHRDGYILTNQHVVRRASGIRVTSADGREFEARLVGVDTGLDLALLKIDADAPLPWLPFAPTHDIYLGEVVIALGNPFGLENTVSVGRVSHRGRQLREGNQLLFEDVVQIDAAINPGNSGGPLVDVAGDLVGINTAILAHSQGIGFALPLREVEPVIARLLAPERVGETWEGIRFDDGAAGAVVAEVEAGSPAEDAGLRAGDRVVETDGTPVTRALEHRFAVLGRTAGDAVGVLVDRDGTVERREIVFRPLERARPERLAQRRLGISVQPMTAALGEALGLGVAEGVLVSDVEGEGPAAAAGLETGMMIVEAGGRAIRSVDDLGEALEGVETGDVLPLAVLISQRRRGVIVRRAAQAEVVVR